MSLTGLTWDGVEDIPQPVFPDILSIDTSSELEESDLYARIAEEEYLLELSQQNPKKLSVGATADSDRYLGEGLNVNPSLEKNNIGVLGEIGWEGRNWNLGLSGGGAWDEDYSFTPVLTISGTWHSDSSSESDELTLRSLQNTATLRRGEYLDLRRSFEEESLDFWNRILSWERSSAELDAKMDYQTALLEYTKVRYERGLIPDEDLHDAEFELELLKIDRSVLLLEETANPLADDLRRMFAERSALGFEVRGAVAGFGDPLLRKLAGFDAAQRLFHAILDRRINDPRAVVVLAPLGGVRDDRIHLLDAALIDQVDDELRLMDALKVGHFRRISGHFSELQAPCITKRSRLIRAHAMRL